MGEVSWVVAVPCSVPFSHGMYSGLLPSAPLSHWLLAQHPHPLPLVMLGPGRMLVEAHLAWPALVGLWLVDLEGLFFYFTLSFLPCQVKFTALFILCPSFCWYAHQNFFANLPVHALKCSNKHLGIAAFLYIHPSINCLFMINSFSLFSWRHVLLYVQWVMSMLAFVWFFKCLNAFVDAYTHSGLFSILFSHIQALLCEFPRSSMYYALRRSWLCDACLRLHVSIHLLLIILVRSTMHKCFLLSKN